MSTIRRALVVGVETTGMLPRLAGSTNDAHQMADRLETHLFPTERPNWTVTRLYETDGRLISISELQHQITDLFLGHADAPPTDSPDTSGSDTLVGARPTTELLLYFSGHAIQHPWGAELIAHGGPAMSFNDLMSLVNQSTADAITIILDCCVSGGLGNEVDAFRPDRAVLREGLAILTAARKDENAVERTISSDYPVPIGSFTQLLVSGLDGAAADVLGAVTELDLYAYATPGFNDATQRPTLKSHITTVRPLRQVAPRVERKRLVEIANLFPTVDWAFELTAAHDYVENEKVGENERPSIKREGGGYPNFGGSTKQVELDHLKMYRDAGLAKASDGRDFWELCKGEKTGTVELTPLGRHYWTLVKRGTVTAE